MADYLEALRDLKWNPVDDALAKDPERRFLPATVERTAVLPAVRPAPPSAEVAVVEQPRPVQSLTPPERPYDPWPARLGFGSVFMLASGTGVYIACAGVHSAGPYLPWAAGASAALAMFVAALKHKSGPSVKIGRVHMEAGANFQAGNQQ